MAVDAARAPRLPDRIRRLAGAALATLATLALGGLALGGSPRTAQAQQRVTLRIRPPVGDTLRMAMQQQFDLEPEDSTGAPQGVMTGALLVWTHAVVRGRTGT